MEAHMEDGERIARVEVGMEAQTGQLDRMERDLNWLRTEFGKSNARMDTEFGKTNSRMDTEFGKMNERMEQGFGKINERMELGFARQNDRFDRSMEELRGTMERGLAENRKENMANVRWLIALTSTIILAVIGLLANAVLRS
jgi:hypothetical protein